VTLMPRRRYLAQMAAGTVFLAVAFFYLVPHVIEAIVRSSPGNGLAVLILIGLGAMNVPWLIMVVALLIVGAGKRRWGFAAATVVFCVLWLVASVATRVVVQSEQAVGDWSPPIPAEAKTYRTLIIDYWYQIGRNVVANGAVDRLVEVNRDNSHVIKTITETTLARGDQCTAADRSDDLAKVGRIDECYKQRRLDAVPDGLVIAFRYDVDAVHGKSGCCNAVEARRREQGEETLLVSWRQGYGWVLSFFPWFGGLGGHSITLSDTENRIWQGLAGPWLLVRYGRPEIGPEAMAGVIYDVDVKGPPKAPNLSNDELLDKAEALLSSAPTDAHAAFQLLVKAKKQGLVDERSMRVAAMLVGHDTPPDTLSNYRDGLAPAQIEQLVAAALERIATPDICKNCYGSAEFWTMLNEVPNPERYTEKARRIFEERSDLQVWQYEAALRMATGLVVIRDTPEYAQLRAQYFQAMMTDTSPALGARAIAFERAFNARNTDELPALAEKLDQVSDDLLHEFVWRLWGASLSRDQRTAEQDAQAAKVCARISRVSTGKNRPTDYDVRC
jgi:hypothetical protein